MTVKLYNLKNEVVGDVELPNGVFGVRWNPSLIKQALVAQRANRRRPWAHVKGRSEVRGGGRKPWRQKGTGRARHGSIRSPIWRGGGKAHGPIKEKDYSLGINKKMRRLALFSALSKKLKDDEIRIFDSLKPETPKTKDLSASLRPIVGVKKGTKKLDLLMIAAADQNLIRAGRNLVKTKVLHPESLNVYDILTHKNLFLEKDSIPVIAKHYRINKDYN